MKVNVVGTSGSGKSTFARRLSQAMSVPYIEMDTLYWRENWQGCSDDEMSTRLATALAASDGWVLDGNYNRTRPIKWQDVDIIIWVDSSFWRTLWQSLSRAVNRAWTQKELWPGTGNRESFRRSFFSRQSIIWWMLKTWRSNRRRYLADIVNPAYAHIRFVRLRSKREADALIAELTIT